MIDNKLQLYFPQIIQQFGWLLLLFGFLSFIKAIPIPNLLVPAAGILLGVVLSWAFRGVQLDLPGKRIKQYAGIFGIKLGSWKHLPKLQEIVFTSGSYSQQIHSWVSRSQLNTRIFKAFLKGTDDYKVLFSAGRNPEPVKKDAATVAENFELPAFDYTVKPRGKIGDANG